MNEEFKKFEREIKQFENTIESNIKLFNTVSDQNFKATKWNSKIVKNNGDILNF